MLSFSSISGSVERVANQNRAFGHVVQMDQSEASILHSILTTSQIPSGRLGTSFIAGAVARHAVNSLIKKHFM